MKKNSVFVQFHCVKTIALLVNFFEKIGHFGNLPDLGFGGSPDLKKGREMICPFPIFLICLAHYLSSSLGILES